MKDERWVTWKHQEELRAGTRLDLCRCRPWHGACEGCFRCPRCRNVVDIAIELTLEWEDTGQFEEISDLCMPCALFITKETRNAREMTLKEIMIKGGCRTANMFTC